MDGEEKYLPDFEEALTSPAYKAHMNRLNIPIALLYGSENQVFQKENLTVSLERLRAAHPEQKYEYIELDGYGHLDLVFAKDSPQMSFPKIAKWFDDFAENNQSENKSE